MAEMKTYAGGCHCGKVRYEVKAAFEAALMCNCSICSRAGWLLGFVPAEQFKLLSGEDALTDYQFGRKNIHHLFCSTCGVRSFGRGTGPNGAAMAAINLRCLEAFDPEGLPVTKFDGKSL